MNGKKLGLRNCELSRIVQTAPYPNKCNQLNQMCNSSSYLPTTIECDEPAEPLNLSWAVLYSPSNIPSLPCFKSSSDPSWLYHFPSKDSQFFPSTIKIKERPRRPRNRWSITDIITIYNSTNQTIAQHTWSCSELNIFVLFQTPAEENERQWDEELLRHVTRQKAKRTSKANNN